MRYVCTQLAMLLGIKKVYVRMPLQSKLRNRLILNQSQNSSTRRMSLKTNNHLTISSVIELILYQDKYTLKASKKYALEITVASMYVLNYKSI